MDSFGLNLDKWLFLCKWVPEEKIILLTQFYRRWFVGQEEPSKSNPTSEPLATEVAKLFSKIIVEGLYRSQNGFSEMEQGYFLKQENKMKPRERVNSGWTAENQRRCGAWEGWSFPFLIQTLLSQKINRNLREKSKEQKSKEHEIISKVNLKLFKHDTWW